MSGTSEGGRRRHLCPPAAEDRGLGTAALGLERAGRSAELESSLFSAPDSLSDPSRPMSFSSTKGEAREPLLESHPLSWHFPEEIPAHVPKATHPGWSQQYGLS